MTGFRLGDNFKANERTGLPKERRNTGIGNRRLGVALLLAGALSLGSAYKLADADTQANIDALFMSAASHLMDLAGDGLEAMQPYLDQLGEKLSQDAKELGL